MIHSEKIKKAREILNTWDKKDLINDCLLNMNSRDLTEFINGNE